MAENTMNEATKSLPLSGTSTFDNWNIKNSHSSSLGVVIPTLSLQAVCLSLFDMQTNAEMGSAGLRPEMVQSWDMVS